MEAKFKNSKYCALHVKGVLGFDTESVPVQQFQARCADHILQSTRHPLSKVWCQCPLACQYCFYKRQHTQAGTGFLSICKQRPARDQSY